MTEAAKVVAEEVVEEVAKEEVVQEASPMEQEAMEKGWRPKDDWVANGGDVDEWKPAKLFIKDGELYRALSTNKRELRQTQAALTALQRHHQYVFEKAHQQAIKDLKMEKRLAIREGDTEKLEAVEEQIEEVTDTYQKERANMVQVTSAPAMPPEFEEFIERNPWYVENGQLKREADKEGWSYLNDGGDRTKLLNHIEKFMKQKFPEKFGIKKAAPSPTVAADRTLKGSRVAEIELDELEQQIMKNLVDSGTMTKAEYIKELKRAKGIK